jgi:hypothetical protein
MSGLDHTVDSIAYALLGQLNARAQAEDGPVWFLKNHFSLGRIYAYYSKLVDESSQLLCASLECLAYRATDELVRSKRRHQICGTPRTWFDTTALWSLCERFGPNLKEKVLSDVRAKVEELFHGETCSKHTPQVPLNTLPCHLGKPNSEDCPLTFAEWGMCAYLIGRLDPSDRRRVLAGVNSVLTGAADNRAITIADEAIRRRLLNSGLPLALLGLA